MSAKSHWRSPASCGRLHAMIRKMLTICSVICLMISFWAWLVCYDAQCRRLRLHYSDPQTGRARWLVGLTAEKGLPLLLSTSPQGAIRIRVNPFSESNSVDRNGTKSVSLGAANVLSSTVFSW